MTARYRARSFRQIFQIEADVTPDVAADTLTVRLLHVTQAAHGRAIEPKSGSWRIGILVSY